MHEDFRRQRIDESHRSQQDFALERHQKHLGNFEAELDGKLILDVGSNYPFFGEYIERNHTDSQVVSIDMDQYSGIDARMLANKLGFQDESFDLIFCHAVNLSPDQLDAAIREFIRVLRPNGKVRIGPFNEIANPYQVEMWGAMRAVLAEYRVKGLIQSEVITVEHSERNGKPNNMYALIIQKLTKG